MAVVTLGDVETELGRPISDPIEVAQINQWIGNAEMLIRVRLGDVTLLDQEALTYVIVQAVAARSRNPDALAEESIDDYTYKLPAETRRITIRDEWWALLSPVQDQASGSIRPSFESDLVRWPVQTPPFREWGSVGWFL